jgi:uncharacterized protein
VKLLCDDNLGKLAKYLRILGYDSYFLSTLINAKLLAVMLMENRIVLTRDHHLAARIEAGRVVLIESDLPDQQLRQVIEKLELKPDPKDLFSRCLECNVICNNAVADEIKEKIFPYILKSKKSFKRCPDCGRIYWQGSHYKDMVSHLKEIFGEDFIKT